MTDPMLATVAPDVRAHYAALQAWLAQAIGADNGPPQALLAAHERWLVAELLRSGQARRERLPVAVEASARWRADGVEAQRFIVGTTLAALRTNVGAAMARLADALVLPLPVRERLAALRANDIAPNAVQVGLANAAHGWSQRLYVEGGNLPVSMRAYEWQGPRLVERIYEPHAPENTQPIGDLSDDAHSAWAELVAGQQRALLRADVTGEARALHVALARRPVLEKTAELLKLAQALQVPETAARAWLERLPSGAELTVVALGRDSRDGQAGSLHLNVYVAPNQDDLPQPGPPPGDLRRTPGTVCWTLQTLAGESRGWLLFALPDEELPHRPAARSPGVQVFAGSMVPDSAALAARLAAVATPIGCTLMEKLARADAALQQILAEAGLMRGR